MAFGLTIRMVRPGGHPSPFCDAVSTTSRPQSSNRISSLPAEQTASTTTKVSGDTSCTISAIEPTLDSTPVDVSTCVIVTSL